MNDDDAPAFRTIAELVHGHALARPGQPALTQRDGETLSYAQLDALMDRVAAALQRDGVRPGDAVAVCAAASPRYAALFLGALRAGAVVAPLAPSVTRESFAAMLADARPRLLFVDSSARDALGHAPASETLADAAASNARDHAAASDAPGAAAADESMRLVALGDGAPGTPLDRWLAPEGVTPQPVEIGPAHPFNIIYSSGTTGTPKGIVQPHGMRWTHVTRAAPYGYGPDTVTLLATPLYSNTTLVVFFPTLAYGGTVVLMPKFDAAGYLALAQAHRMTHTMLVPVQYQRIMALPTFGDFGLSATRMKFCTSAPFGAALKADVLARWPGGLVEFYGMTEGGGTCILSAHEHPDKLHTVGRPAPGHDIRLIDEAGRELGPGDTGEVVGRSAGMMSGYHGRPEKTREAEWFDADGKRFIRTGDVGRFDADGFLVLMDRRKDMIISGGFNIYPSDLEAVLLAHPAVAEAAVVGVPSRQWGETPLAFVVLRNGAAIGDDELLRWANERLGRTQRLARLRLVAELPRSAIGKVLKRELRDAHVASAQEPR